MQGAWAERYGLDCNSLVPCWGRSKPTQYGKWRLEPRWVQEAEAIEARRPKAFSKRCVRGFIFLVIIMASEASWIAAHEADWVEAGMTSFDVRIRLGARGLTQQDSFHRASHAHAFVQLHTGLISSEATPLITYLPLPPSFARLLVVRLLRPTFLCEMPHESATDSNSIAHARLDTCLILFIWSIGSMIFPLHRRMLAALRHENRAQAVLQRPQESDRLANRDVLNPAAPAPDWDLFAAPLNASNRRPSRRECAMSRPPVAAVARSVGLVRRTNKLDALPRRDSSLRMPLSSKGSWHPLHKSSPFIESSS